MVKASGPDNHKLLYDTTYESTPTQIHHRVLRNKARRELEREGLVHKGDNKDVDHKRALAAGGTGARSNLRAVSEHVNRGYWKGKDR